MSKQVKENKGITLIALVITIIVLLILAGVSIAMLSGDNSILKNAQQAKKQTEITTNEEKIRIALMGAYDSTGSFNTNMLKQELDRLGATYDSIVGSDIMYTSGGKKKIMYGTSGEVREVGASKAIIDASRSSKR